MSTVVNIFVGFVMVVVTRRLWFFSDNFDWLVNFSTVNSFDVSTSENWRFFNIVVFEDFLDSFKVRIHYIREKFKGRITLRLVKWFNSNESFSVESFDHHNSFVDQLFSLSIRVFFKVNYLSIRLRVCAIEHVTYGLL